jgi:hypothetical protein
MRCSLHIFILRLSVSMDHKNMAMHCASLPAYLYVAGSLQRAGRRPGRTMPHHHRINMYNHSDFSALTAERRKDLAGPRPTIITPHGGPHSAYSAQFFMPLSFMVALGELAPKPTCGPSFLSFALCMLSQLFRPWWHWVTRTRESIQPFPLSFCNCASSSSTSCDSHFTMALGDRQARLCAHLCSSCMPLCIILVQMQPWNFGTVHL